MGTGKYGRQTVGVLEQPVRVENGKKANNAAFLSKYKLVCMDLPLSDLPPLYHPNGTNQF
ncbi:hypothetical protein GCM10027423_38660 [Spirosoma arcticum]